MSKHEFGPIDYGTRVAPQGYKCTKCSKQGCKLWREYQTFANATDLYCCDCAGIDQKKDISSIDENGCRLDKWGGRTDQIGWLVPAVPTEDGDTFWGYTSVPQPGVDWWIKLPTRV